MPSESDYATVDAAVIHIWLRKKATLFIATSLDSRTTTHCRSALQRQHVNLPVHLPVPGFIEEKKQVTRLWEEQFLSCEAYRKCISQGKYCL
ncbi:hypothetical protein SRHO_G00219870 [Serrasalmus rhombeus]